MAATREPLAFGAFALDCRADGVAIATFSRPPVNAFSIAEYRALGDLIARETAPGPDEVVGHGARSG